MEVDVLRAFDMTVAQRYELSLTVANGFVAKTGLGLGIGHTVAVPLAIKGVSLQVQAAPAVKKAWFVAPD